MWGVCLEPRKETGRKIGKAYNTHISECFNQSAATAKMR